MPPFDQPHSQSELIFASDAQTDSSLTAPEPAPSEGEPSADSKYPGHWAHRKLAWVDANIAQDDSLFNGVFFVSLRARFIEPEQSNPNKWLRIWSYQPGYHQIWDPESRQWVWGGDAQNSVIVRVPEHELWLPGYRFCPLEWASINESNRLVLYVQNWHQEGDRMVWEGNEPPNQNNQMEIDRRIEYPFPNGQFAYRFPG